MVFSSKSPQWLSQPPKNGNRTLNCIGKLGCWRRGTQEDQKMFSLYDLDSLVQGGLLWDFRVKLEGTFGRGTGPMDSI